MTRFEWSGERWELVGASYARRSAAAAADSTETLTGGFVTGERYGGCPGCGARGFVLCTQCENLSCWVVSSPTFTCGTCGVHGTVSGYIDALHTATGR